MKKIFLLFINKKLLISSLLFLPILSSAEVTISGGGNSIVFDGLPEQTKSIILTDEYGLLMKNESGQFLSETEFQDGLYQYQVMAEETLSEARQSQYKKSLNNGRSAQQKQSNSGLKLLESGSFSIKQGQIIDTKEVEQESK